MLCPSCRGRHNRVIDSRETEVSTAIRRRRVCLSCDRRFTTKERVEEDIRLAVIKANGQRVPYNRDKVCSGVERACLKLDIGHEQIESLVDLVEHELFAAFEREVTTEEIGQTLGPHLRRLSPVAYVRFMSVHRKFSTIDEFVDEIRDVRERAAQDHPAQQSLFSA